MFKRLIPAALLIAYTAALVRVLVFKNVFLRIGHLRIRIAAAAGEANFVPFKTIAAYAHGSHGPLIGMVNLIGNVALFIPIGLLAPMVLRRLGWRSALALAAASGLTFEGMEVVFSVGAFDVDDLILNGLGVVIGYGAFAVFGRRARGSIGTFP